MPEPKPPRTTESLHDFVTVKRLLKVELAVLAEFRSQQEQIDALAQIVHDLEGRCGDGRRRRGWASWWTSSVTRLGAFAQRTSDYLTNLLRLAASLMP